MTILGLVDQHRAAVDVLTRECAHLDPRRVEATFQFLSEALATFEMAQRGYWEAKEMAARERAIALMLQHELLPPSLPDVAGLDVAVRYLPGEATSQAGGDWYDLFPLPDGQVGLVVGDVTGHGVAAAASMGQMRMAVLAYALAGFAARRRGRAGRRAGRGAGPGPRGHDGLRHRRTSRPTSWWWPTPVTRCPSWCRAGRAVAWLSTPARGCCWASTRPSTGGPARPSPCRPAARCSSTPTASSSRSSAGSEDGLAQLLEVTSGFRGTPDDLCDHVLAELTPDQSGDDICTLAIGFAP